MSLTLWIIMHASRPSFVKPAPCSRATRIQKELRSSPHMMKVRPLQSTRQILQSILKLMQDSKSSAHTKFQELYQLLSRMPPWSQWSPQADSVVGSMFEELQPKLSTDEEKTPKTEEKNSPEFILASTLIELNGNNPIIKNQNLDECDQRLEFVFLQWLHAVHAPHDKKCHVQHESGFWLTDRELRTYLKEGAELHIPTRTVGESVTNRPGSALSPADNNEDES